MNFLRRITSVLLSLLRLVLVMTTAFFTALNKIFFDNMEVISMTLVVRPQAYERATLGFIDKLRYNNRELVEGASIPKSDAFDDDEPFLPDDLLDEAFDDDEEDEKVEFDNNTEHTEPAEAEDINVDDIPDVKNENKDGNQDDNGETDNG